MTISLDFELFWGVRDAVSLASYEANLRNVPLAIDGMLKLFERYEIHATWATVGALMLEDYLGFQRACKDHQRPGYEDAGLCPFEYCDQASSLDPALHFAPELIARISATRGQEVGSHTFSHFYCLEDGVTKESFRADLHMARETGATNGFVLDQIVFPRNQVQEDFLSVLAEFEYRGFRGNQQHWIHKASRSSKQGLLRRALRLLDAYLPITGDNTIKVGDCKTGYSDLYSVPASAFLRPVPGSSAGKLLEPLRLARITSSLKSAAASRTGYHLWWHPHNFGCNLEANLSFLESVLRVFDELRTESGFRSLSMGEVVTEVEQFARG